MSTLETVKAPGPRSHWLLLLVLLLATLAAYQPAWHGGMVWDDEAHVTRPDLQSVGGLGRIWREVGATQQYYPLVHSAFWIEHALWGDDTFGYHIVNITLHAVTALLLALILQHLAVRGAWVAAVIFALHPVHVESVAWVSELKNVLSGMLMLAAAWCYLRFDERRAARSYGLALLLFVLALLSKTVSAMFPAAMLLVLWWQHGRILWRRDVLPLVPFFALGVLGALLTIWIERTLIGAEGADFELSAVERLLVAGRAVWFYLATLLWPRDLVFIYPRWDVRQNAVWQYLFPLALIGTIVALWWLRHRWRGPLAALLVFIALVAPALGFVNVYPFRYSFVADHFQYHASTAIIALVAATLVGVAMRLNVKPRAATYGAMLAIGAPLAVLTWQQAHQYRDAEALYRSTLAKNPASWFANNNLGMIYLDQSPETALTHFRAAVAAKPDLAEAHNNIGSALERLGRIPEALTSYFEAQRIDPSLAANRKNLCHALQQMDRLDEAIGECEAAVRLAPDNAEARYNLGLILHRLGRTPEAVVHYVEALRLQPDSAPAHNDLGIALVQLNAAERGIAHLQEAIRLSPSYPDPYFNLASVHLQARRFDQAIAGYTEALKHKPDDPRAHYLLATAYEALGRPADALVHYREALRLDPATSDARDAIARLVRP
jgi:tetratricopeptide (TPR) repeat protein